LHLTTLFPEVRLKNTLEVRSVDALTPDLAMASLGIWTGLLYDQEALNAASALVEPWTFSEVESGRSQLCDRALSAPVCGRDGFAWAEALFEIAKGGLSRRARKNSAGQDETVLLAPAQEILERRKVPAERALQRFAESGSLISATKITLPTS
jgi:glutamate--cysteine ligase